MASCLTCKLANDILRTNSCGYSLPEVTDIYLANYSDVVSTALDADGQNITGITLATGYTQSITLSLLRTLLLSKMHW